MLKEGRKEASNERMESLMNDLMDHTSIFSVHVQCAVPAGSGNHFA